MSNLRVLRDYQNRINLKVTEFLKDPNKKRGQIYAPTGSGKTECFGHTVHDLPQIIKALDDKNLNIAIVHPRIALSQEQLGRFKQIFGEKYHYTSFHSGVHVKGKETTIENSTTNPDELIATIYNSAKTHITFSSYDSFYKIAHIEFDLLILDEAHNLVQACYFNALESIAAKKALFYTATPINRETEGDELVGMGNIELFGDIIVRVDPSELIRKGYIVAPVVHFLKVNTTRKGVGVDTTDVIIDAFKHQRQEMQKYRMPFIQMLVASRGLEDHKKVESELAQLWEKLGDIVPLYCIEANSTRKNGREFKSRYETLAEIRASGKNAIIMHYDTLSEGIDIGTLTGVCILRKLAKYKLIQTIGRPGRPYFADLNEKYEVRDMNKRMKPVSVITLPIVDGEHIGGLNSSTIVEAFAIGGYGDLTTYLPEEDKKNLSKKENLFDLGEDDKDTVLAHILDSQVERYVRHLASLGFVF